MQYQFEYVLNYETILLVPEFDKEGRLCTRVIESNRQFLCPISPTKLVDMSCRNFGSSLRGANDGTSTILGNVNMKPVIVSEVLDIYLFPSCAPTSRKCIWFAVHHIKGYKSMGKKKTRVFLSNGRNFDVDLSVRQFEERIQRAYMLKYNLESRTKLMLIQHERAKVIYPMMNDAEKWKNAFIIKEDEEVDE